MDSYTKIIFKMKNKSIRSQLVRYFPNLRYTPTSALLLPETKGDRYRGN